MSTKKVKYKISAENFGKQALEKLGLDNKGYKVFGTKKEAKDFLKEKIKKIFTGQELKSAITNINKLDFCFVDGKVAEIKPMYLTHGVEDENGDILFKGFEFEECEAEIEILVQGDGYILENLEITEI